MFNTSRHECIVYAGAPSDYLRSLAKTALRKLEEGYRCLYLNSPTMVAGFRSALSAAGVNVAEAVASKKLVLSSQQDHLVDGRFDPDRMIADLRVALSDALNDGHTGLWASGDMAWELGSPQNFCQIEIYERLLEEFVEANPRMCGICQYHIDTLSREASRLGLTLHRSIHVDENLSVPNFEYVEPTESGNVNVETLDEILGRLSSRADET